MRSGLVVEGIPAVIAAQALHQSFSAHPERRLRFLKIASEIRLNLVFREADQCSVCRIPGNVVQMMEIREKIRKTSRDSRHEEEA